MTRNVPPAGKVLRHPAPLRLIHWTHVSVTLALAFTGFDLAHPFLPPRLFPPKYARLAHSTLASALAATFALWLYYAFTTGAWRELLPDRRDWRTAGALLRYELLLSEDSPMHGKYHLIQKVLYLSFHLAIGLQILTGWALAAYVTRSGSLLIRLAGGLQRIRTVHHFAALYLVLTSTLHLYRALTDPRLVVAMITGWGHAGPPLDTPAEKAIRPPESR
ncbi:MAG TPA: hypothetical protein GXX28_01610 [Firmicutes bacterium]|nr:hypothetical protein [Bacillota bacterium]